MTDQPLPNDLTTTQLEQRANQLIGLAKMAGTAEARDELRRLAKRYLVRAAEQEAENEVVTSH
jgi:hypothetical protein